MLAQVSGLTVDVPLIPAADRQECAQFICTHLEATQVQLGVPSAPSAIADETATPFAALAGDTPSDALSSVSDHSQTTS